MNKILEYFTKIFKSLINLVFSNNNPKLKILECYLLPRSDLNDLDQAATWTCGMNMVARHTRIGGDGRRNCA